MSDPSSSPDPDRKRSLEAETSSDDDDARGGRFKRQALDAETGEPVPRYAPVKEEDASMARLSGSDDDHATKEDVFSGPMVENSSERQTICVRALISTKEAGVVIGKQGRNVADIRQSSLAKVTISELIPGAQDRILSVTGPFEHVAKAFSLVAEKMVLELQLGSELPVPERFVNLRILVPNSKMGWLIGKQGSKIKEIQQNSNARVTAQEGVLPGSTERIIQVVGVMDAIHLAIYHIASALQDYPQRDHYNFIPYKPLPMPMPMPMVGMQHPGGPFGMPGPHPFFPHQNPMMPHPSHHHGHHGGGGGGGGPGMHRGGPPPGAGHLPVQMQQIFIPNDMVGSIIGKQGSKINEVRNMSGCQIKIMEPIAGSADRLVTITGNPEQNQMAMYMLYSRLESEKNRLQGGQPGMHDGHM
ncbi:hypothetical protein DFS34DRAFT_641741 [Phlyctochytrium arcticum]|nr:hypothetical protein DFS34DRAFT_641741 [Phlyctochytrium arcticum]